MASQYSKFSQKWPADPPLQKTQYFYYIDGQMDNFNRDTVKLFGKIYNEEKHIWNSCCVNVNNIRRRIYLQPTEKIIESPTFKSEFYESMRQILKKHFIDDYEASFVDGKRLYHNKRPKEIIPFLKVTYSRQYQEIKHVPGSGPIEKIHGNSASSLEILLTERRIKGPGWLKIESCQLSRQKSTWCNLEMDCDSLTNVSVCEEDKDSLKDPPLVATTIHISVSPPTPHNKLPEIVMIGMKTITNLKSDGCQSDDPLVEECYLVRKPGHGVFKGLTDDIKDKLTNRGNAKIIFCCSEMSLLRGFLHEFNLTQPDIIFILDVYSMSLLASKFAEFDETWMPTRISTVQETHLKLFALAHVKDKFALGRLLKRPICYIKQAIEEVQPKMRRDDIGTICHKILGTSCEDMKPIAESKVPFIYNSKEEIISFIDHIIFETRTLSDLAIGINILPLVLEMTKVTGYVLSGILFFSKPDRSEYLLSHVFTQEGYILPDKLPKSHTKDTFEGGLSLDAIVGLHDKFTILMDFRSLYPSIIQEYNLCMTTIPGVRDLPLDKLQLPDKIEPPGILPKVIGQFIEIRNQAKKKMNEATSPEVRLQNNIIQLCYKILANSLCGCLGSPFFRYYTINLAALITSIGRSTLLSTKSIVENKGYLVLYGDTDSLMVNTGVTDYDAALAIAKDIMDEVNAKYKYIKFDVDAVYRHVLIDNKKTYRASLIEITPDGERKLTIIAKGSQVKQNYTCQLIDNALEFIDKTLLSDFRPDEKIEKIRAYFGPLSEILNKQMFHLLEKDVIIKKKLLYDPEKDPIQKKAETIAANRYNQMTDDELKKLRQGDCVEFVMRMPDKGCKLEDRAFPVVDLDIPKFPIDLQFYFFDLLVSVAAKACKTIPDLNDRFFATSLGVLDKYDQYLAARNRFHKEPIQPQIEFFSFKCSGCLKDVVMDDFWTTVNNTKIPYLQQCPTCGETDISNYLINVPEFLQTAMNKWIKKWHGGKKVWCQRDTCDISSTDLSKIKSGNLCPEANHGKRYIERMEILFCEQFMYLIRIFNIDEQPVDLTKTLNPSVVNIYRYFSKVIHKTVDGWGIMNVDLDRFEIAVTKCEQRVARKRKLPL